MECLFFQRVVQRVVIERDLDGCAGATINDAWGLASIAQAAARSGPLLFACECNYFHFKTPLCARRFALRLKSPATRGFENPLPKERAKFVGGRTSLQEWLKITRRAVAPCKFCPTILLIGK